MHSPTEVPTNGLDHVIKNKSPELKPANFDETLISVVQTANDVEALQRGISTDVGELIAKTQYKVEEFYQFHIENSGIDHNRIVRRTLASANDRIITDTHTIINGSRLVASGKADLNQTRDQDLALWAPNDYLHAKTYGNTEVFIVSRAMANIFCETIKTAYDDLGPRYAELYHKRREALVELYGYLIKNPSDMSQFLTILEDQSTNPDPDLDPLMTILANDIFDPAGDNIAQSFWSKLETGEVTLDLRNEFITDQLRNLSDETIITDHNGDVLQFARLMFPSEESEFIQATIEHYEQWPQTLKDAYSGYHKQVLSYVGKSLESILLDKVRKGRFEPTSIRAINGDGIKENSGRGPGKKKRNGRATPRQRSSISNETIAEVEHGIKLSGFGRILKTDNGHIFEKCKRDKIISLVEDYVKKYNSGPDVFEDLINMIESIYRVPFGEGATPFVSNSKIKLDSHNLHVWHLNPAKRPGLTLATSNARRARVKYCTVKDPNTGEMYLGIIGISHHNDIDQNRIT